MSRQQDVLDATLESLSHLICGDRVGTTDGEGFYISPIHRVPATRFDGFEPITHTTMLVEDGILAGDNPADQPVWPLHCVLAGRSMGEGWPDGTWQFDCYQTLKPREWRGILHQIHPRMIDHSTLFVMPGGKTISHRTPFALVNGKLIDVPRTHTGLRVNASAGHMNPGYFGDRYAGPGNAEEIEDARRNASMMCFLGGWMLRKRYNWSVLLGEGKGPRARFITDATGMRDIFRLRDIPPGRARRAALLHWVRAHHRQRRDTTANDRIWVQKHIRGVWSYQWNGLLCQIEPPAYELEMLMKDPHDLRSKAPVP